MTYDPVELVVGTTLTGGGGFMLKVLVDRFFKRAEVLEQKEETSAATHAKVTDTKLDAVNEKLAKIATQLEVMTAAQATRDGESKKLEERINGISDKHGKKLDDIIDRVTRLEEREKMAAERMGRRK